MTRMLDVSNTRGTADHGWLHSRHTFSFASYYNPERMGFGMLRVINDDIVAPSGGFATHPHKNMEIISLPLTGSLRHQDNMGNRHVIRAGEVQAMSAGTGITHSEYNNSESEKVNFLQIWVLPKDLEITPRYDQQVFDVEKMHNNFSLIVAPLGTENIVNINQDAYFSLAHIDANETIKYQKHNVKNGVYFFIINGVVDIGSQKLDRRDGIGITDEDSLVVNALEQAEVLCMEVPMV